MSERAAPSPATARPCRSPFRTGDISARSRRTERRNHISSSHSPAKGTFPHSSPSRCAYAQAWKASLYAKIMSTNASMRRTAQSNRITACKRECAIRTERRKLSRLHIPRATLIFMKANFSTRIFHSRRPQRFARRPLTSPHTAQALPRSAIPTAPPRTPKHSTGHTLRSSRTERQQKLPTRRANCRLRKYSPRCFPQRTI